MLRAERGHDDGVAIVGAGPSGLACAIVLARSGVAVTVHEARATVGARFHGDFQGLENWSSRIDVLDELRSYGIAPAFDHVPIRDGIAFDDRSARYEIHSAAPLFYLVRRGSDRGTLDRSLHEQALEAGVTVRFHDKVDSLDSHTQGVIAAGPRLPYAIAAGFVFETAMRNGCYIRFDERVAPGGYAYLIVQDGRGTVASCLFHDFKNEQMYVDRTIDAFTRDAGLRMERPVAFGGSGSFFFRRRARQGKHPVAGEYAGLQDALLGFGMRWAMRSGVWAARAQMGIEDLEQRFRRDVRPQLASGVVNRLLFDRFGNAGHRWLLRRLVRSAEPREFVRMVYAGNPILRFLAPLARAADRARLRDPSCRHENCSCVWCRFERLEHAAAT
jgi:flavin-dependent dehydrogenase